MNITKISVNRPTLVVVVFTILIFLGFAGYKGLNSELMPSMTAPAFMVMTAYPGASASEVSKDFRAVLESQARHRRVGEPRAPLDSMQGGRGWSIGFRRRSPS